eukprot:6559779-Prymnesium_polylepis.1
MYLAVLGDTGLNLQERELTTQKLGEARALLVKQQAPSAELPASSADASAHVRTAIGEHGEPRQAMAPYAHTHTDAVRYYTCTQYGVWIRDPRKGQGEIRGAEKSAPELSPGLATGWRPLATAGD